MKITENFEYIGTQQNFERDSYATLAEMKAVVDKRMPDIFTATCKETGKLYIYNKSNEIDETLGKWREIGAGAGESNSSDYLSVEGENNTVYLVSSGNKTEVSPDDIFSYENLPLHITKDGFVSDIELRYVGDISGEGKT